MKRPYITVTQNLSLVNLLTGILFIVTGGLFLVDHSPILVIFLSLLIITTLVFTWISKQQKMDEMARAHFHEAYHVAYLSVMIMLICLELLELCGIGTFKMFAVTSLCLGTGNISVGIAFRKFERDGDL